MKGRVKFVTTTGAARIMKVSPSTALRAVESGRSGLRFFITPGGHYRIDPASAKAWAGGGLKDAVAEEKEACARVAAGGPIYITRRAPIKWINVIREAIAAAIRARQ